MNAKNSILLLFLSSVILGLLRSGTSGWPFEGSEEKVQINFWNGFTGPDGRVMLRMIREFNEANPDINVTMQRMEWGIYYNKLMVAGIGGRGPDIFVVTAGALPRIERAGFLGNADALYAGKDRVPAEDFDPRLLELCEFNGHIVGLPMDVHPQGMYSNARMLKNAGIVDAAGHPYPPRDRKQFLAAVKRLKIAGESAGRVDQWGFALTVWRLNFMSLVPQFGGRYFDESGQCILDCEENIAALEFLVSLLGEDDLIPPPENGLGWIGFRQGKIAMVFDGIYMLGDLHRLNNVDYMASPLPQIGPHPGTYGDSHVLCLRAELPAAKQAAVLKFMRFLADSGLQWAEAGQIPARISARETEEFSRMKSQAAFAEQLPYVAYPPRTPGLFELQQQIDYAVERAMLKRVTPAEALREARVNFETYMDNANLPMIAKVSKSKTQP